MLRVAIIGFGFMGVTHAVNIQRNKRLALQAIITRHPEELESKLTGQTGNFSSGETDVEALKRVPRYTSLQECLRHEHLDVVHICVHTDLHYTLAIEAMDLGLHVFLEKPMSLNLDEARRMIAHAREKRVKLMVGHVVRFMPPYVQLKQWIDDGTFGALQFISLTRFTGLPMWGQWKEKQQQFGTSGGALFDLVIHDIDFLNYALGKPDKIEAVCYPGALSNNDYITAHWHYGPLHARIEGGNIFHPAFPFQAGFMARFEKASVAYSTLNPEHIQIAEGETLRNVAAGAGSDGFYNEIDYFATCVEEDKETSENPPGSSLQTLELCFAHLPKS